MLTETTMQVLKNFATINPNIVIETGNVIKTMSEGKNIVSRSELDVEFTKNFGIFDLNQFLATLSLVDSPNLKFEDDFVVISDSVGRTRIKYYYSSPEVLTTPTRDVVLPDAEVKFTLDRDTLAKVRRAASVLGHEFVNVTCIDNVVCLSVTDTSDATANAYTVDVDGTYTKEDFNLVFKIDNLKMIEGDYDVSISSKLVSHFINKTNNIEYWVALEKTSTYGA